MKVKPVGPTCHTGEDTCWGEKIVPVIFCFIWNVIYKNEKMILPEVSYTARLIAKGINKVVKSGRRSRGVGYRGKR